MIFNAENCTTMGSSSYPVFKDCTNQISLTIGENVKSIPDYAFSGCSGLTSVTIPNSVTSIGEEAFAYCKGLTLVSIGRFVTSIGNCAFCNCSGLIFVTIGNSVTSIGSSAFSGCSGLTSVTIPNLVTSIGGGAFSGCSGLTSVTIPNSVTSIGMRAFSGCSGLTSVIFNAENCTTMGNSYSPVFEGCTNLTSLTIGENVNTIPNFAFSGCSGLTSVTIPNSVTSICMWAFSGCSGLTSVTIGNSVTSIGDDAFSGCSGLTSVSIPNSVTSIGDSAFSGCSGLTSVIICNSVTSIGDSAFSGCSGLTSVTIPNSVTSIGDSAFSGCCGLTEVIFNAENCTKMGSESNSVFSICSNLISLTIGNKVKTIPSYAFLDCTGLTSVTIPNSVTSIGASAFSDCSGLASVTIGNSVTSIGDNVFYNCSELTSVKIGNSVTSIGASAFYGCDNLEMVIFNATNSNSCAFSSSKDLTFIVGEAVVSIPDNIIYNGGSGGVSKVIALADTPPTATSETFDSSVTSSATLYVKKNTVYKYFMADGWSDFANINTIDNLVTNISLDKTSVNLSLGETCKLNAVVEPADATLTDIIWTASNSCVSVDQDGNIKGLSEGQCIVTAEAIDGTGIKAECVVNVGNIYAQSLRLSQETLALEVNGMAKLSCTILPGDTTIKTVEWSCSNESVATFNENADNTITVVGVESGVATITVRTTDGSNLAAICTVYVGEAGAETIDSDAVKVASKGGAIRISGAAGAVAEVYSLSGMLLYCGTDTSIALPRGVYIVKVAGTTTKVIL